MLCTDATTEQHTQGVYKGHFFESLFGMRRRHSSCGVLLSISLKCSTRLSGSLHWSTNHLLLCGGPKLYVKAISFWRRAFGNFGTWCFYIPLSILRCTLASIEFSQGCERSLTADHIIRCAALGRQYWSNFPSSLQFCTSSKRWQHSLVLRNTFFTVTIMLTKLLVTASTTARSASRQAFRSVATLGEGSLDLDKERWPHFLEQ